MPAVEDGLSWFSKNLIETLPAAVYVCDIDAVVVAFNKRACELWGRTPEPGDTDLRFCGSHKLFRPDGSYMPHAETPMDRVLRTGEYARDMEVIIEQPGGVRVTVLVNISPIFDAAGVQIGAVNCFQDLTAQKQSEEERTRLREDLRQSQKLEAMGQLVGGIAHDFNNLLSPIMAALDMADRRALGAEREQRAISGALQAAERAKSLVQRLLAFARKQPLQSRSVDMPALIGGIMQLIESASGSQISVVIDMAANLPPAKADPAQLEMAILNLAVNARDAMPSGGVLRISVAYETTPPAYLSSLGPGPFVRLSIADTGVGMDEATLAKAVEPFFSTKPLGQGTGLGLSMAQGLAAQLGGALDITSKPGVGTTIDLWLQVSVDSAEAIKPKIAAVSMAKSVGVALLVDDEEIVRMGTADMLMELGYAVIEANSAEDAWTLFNSGLHIDLLVTDHLMHGMTGGELALAILKTRKDTPILIVSGFTDAESIPADFARLSKPFRQSDLAASLKQLAMAAA